MALVLGGHGRQAAGEPGNVKSLTLGQVVDAVVCVWLMTVTAVVLLGLVEDKLGEWSHLYSRKMTLGAFHSIPSQT